MIALLIDAILHNHEMAFGVGARFHFNCSDLASIFDRVAPNWQYSNIEGVE